MLRNILAAIVGYIAMAAVLFVLFSLLWVTLGPMRAFQPGSWEVSGGWVIGTLALGFVAAFIAGLVCVRVARDARAATLLIALVIVFGLVRILMPMEMPAEPRPDDLSMMEATAGAFHPAWFNWLNPLIGGPPASGSDRGSCALSSPFPINTEKGVIKLDFRMFVLPCSYFIERITAVNQPDHQDRITS